MHVSPCICFIYVHIILLNKPHQIEILPGVTVNKVGQGGVKQRHQSTTGAFLMQEVVLVLRSCFVRILCYILLVLYFSLAQKPAKQLIL